MKSVELEKLLRRCMEWMGGDMTAEEARAVMESEQDEEGKARDLRDAFELYLSGQNKGITAESLKRMLSRLGEPNTLDDCKSIISLFDRDGDGQLDFEDFKAMMK